MVIVTSSDGKIATVTSLFAIEAVLYTTVAVGGVVSLEHPPVYVTVPVQLFCVKVAVPIVAFDGIP